MQHNSNDQVFAWQSGHRREMNMSTYGLDSAYPRRLQSELLHAYLWISQLWHRWLGFLVEIANERNELFQNECNEGELREKETASLNAQERTLNCTPQKKRQTIPQSEV